MISEKQLEDSIFEGLASDPEAMNERGFVIPDQSIKCYRQVRFGDYGIADIVMTGLSGEGCPEIVIYELKAQEVSCRDIPQISRYMSAAAQVLVDRGYYKTLPEASENVVGILCAPMCESPLASAFSKNLAFMECRFDALNGIRLVNHTYSRYADYDFGGELIAFPESTEVAA